MSRTLTVVALILVLAGCGDSESSGASETTATLEATQTTTENTQTIESSKPPLACLEEAGLSDVEELNADSWRGLHDQPRYAITIHTLATSAKTPTVVAGEYAVTGSFKVVAVARGLTGDDGIQADALVQVVADCLGG